MVLQGMVGLTVRELQTYIGGSMKIERFEDIDAWKEARTLTKMIYSLTGIGRFSRDFGLRDQVQRASVSVMSNIAEGFDAGSDKAFMNFLNYAYRSATEVQSLLYVAFDAHYFTQTDFQQNFDQASKTKRLIGGLIRYLRGSMRYTISRPRTQNPELRTQNPGHHIPHIDH